MASKLTAQAPCGYRSSEGDFDMGGVGVNDCRWDSGRQEETWINGFFCDDNCSAIGRSIPANSYQTDLSEPDWISKEINFREFFSSDRPNSWELFKDQQDFNVLSALAAVTALFRDWCVLENFGNISGLSSDHLSDIDAELSKEVHVFASLLLQNNGFEKSKLDSPLGGLLKKHCRDIVMPCTLCQSHYWGEARSGEKPPDAERTDFSGSSLEEQSQVSDLLLLENWRPAERHDKCGHNDVTSSIFAPTYCSLTDGRDSFGGLNMHAIFGKQISSTSRFSFGREDGALSSPDAERMSPSRSSEQPAVMDCMASGNSILERGNTYGTDLDGVYSFREGELVGEDLVPEGLLYALSYMSLQDLLNMEKVCTSLRSRIKNDVLLWQRLHIELPMSNSLTDEVFLELASRSRGQLLSLSLVDCTRVTESALEHVVLSNLRLSKLSLPGCSRISADAVVRIVSSIEQSNLKQLRVRNMDGFTKDHLQSLQKVVGAHAQTQDQISSRKPQYYHLKHHASFDDDDRAIDVEECPKCTNVRLVYDCTRERCQIRRGLNAQDCQACILCIVRCEACGGCITGNDYEETFSLDVLCSHCWLGLPKCTECNRPACASHADHFIRTPETTFVCGDCCGTLEEPYGSKFRVCA